MPPKSSKREGDGDVQGLLLEKDLEIETLLDKIFRLEKRSESLETTMEKQQIATKEMEEKLQDVITCLTSELKVKQEKVYELENELKNLIADSTKTIEDLTKEMYELQNAHKFTVDDLHLQLANAQVQLRDIDEFTAKKIAIEQEIANLKMQFEKERKEHEEAISDTERSALQDKERLKKEITSRIEDTRMLMLQQMDEQLNAKTKKTIIENEQLGKELSYHIRQTQLLLQKNEKLIQENIELHRQVLLAKEVENELARKNHMNQKTIRILLYKLRGMKPVHEQESTPFTHEHELEQYYHHIEDQVKSYIDEQKRALESISSGEAAMKFLYTCLEDIDLEKFDSSEEENDYLHEVDKTISSSDGTIMVPSSLDQLTRPQRKKLLIHLLRTAVSLRAIEQDMAIDLMQTQRPRPMVKDLLNPSKKEVVSVEDILSFPMNEEKPTFLCNVGRTSSRVSVGTQTKSMKLEERLALDIEERLRTHSSMG